MKITIRLLLAILLLAHAGGHAAAGARESGTMIKADQLKAEPYSDARDRALKFSDLVLATKVYALTALATGRGRVSCAARRCSPAPMSRATAAVVPYARKMQIE